MNRARAWVTAARPKTLRAAASPVLVGSAIAFVGGAFEALPAAAAFAGALLLQLGSNFANDVYDFERGADTAERLGPVRVTQAGMLTGAEVKRGMWAVFGMAVVMGIYLTVVAGWPVVLIGLASITAAIAYSGGPFPFGYRGLGDLFVMVFFGFVAVGGTTFVQMGRLPGAAWPAGLMVGSLATAILVVNNVRDHETDRATGKRTLPAIFGRGFGVVEYGVLLATAYVAAYGMVWLEVVSAWALLCFATAPVAVILWVHVRKHRGPALNATLVHTAQLMFLFSLLFSFGALVGSLQ